MKHITALDTIGLQIDCEQAYLQRELLDNLLTFVMEEPSLYISHKDYPVDMYSNTIRRVYFIYINSRTVATITTGSYQGGSIAKGNYRTVFYINIKFAGLKTYHDAIDKASHDALLKVCAYLNTRGILFKLTELDVCIDVESAFENMLTICVRKTPRTKYYNLNSNQAYDTTTYIERISKQKLRKSVMRAYMYDKSHKEQLDSSITRFEIKLQPKFFNKHGFSIGAIQKALDRYYVMHFKDVNDKNSIIDAYSNYSVVRKREIVKLGLEEYRMCADMNLIAYFIDILRSVTEDDIIYDMAYLSFDTPLYAVIS